MRPIAFVRALLPVSLALLAFACSGDDSIEPVPEFTLTVTVEGDGSGRVTSVPAGIDCSAEGGACSMSVPEGTSVTLTASAEAGSELVGWAGACASDPCTLTMAGARSVTATFDDPLLEVATIGTGGGEITSADGALTMVIPPGALSGDEEITVAVVDPSELGSEWDALMASDEIEAAYELGPDGTTFDEPVTVVMPSEQAAPGEDGSFEVAGDFLFTSDAAEVVELGGLTVELDVDAGTASVIGELSHFSPLVKTRTVAGGTFGVRFEGVPSELETDDTFQDKQEVDIPGGFTADGDPSWIDESELPIFDGEYGYGCQTIGEGTFRAGVHFPTGTLNGRRTPEFRLTVRKTVTCVEGTWTIRVKAVEANSGAGEVVSAPFGIDCHIVGTSEAGECEMTVAATEKVTLEAEAGAGSLFNHWEWFDNSLTQNPLELIRKDFSDPAVISVLFVDRPLQTVTIQAKGDATGTIRDEANGVLCEKIVATEDASCEVQLPEGTQLSLMHEAGTNAEFAGWTGCDEVVDDVCKAQVIPDMTPMVGLFNRTGVNHELKITKTGSGRVRALDYVTSDPDDEASSFTVILDCGDMCAEASTPFKENTNLVLEATPDTDWLFSAWSGDCSGTDERIQPGSLKPLTCHATFVEKGDVEEPALATFSFEDDGISAGTALSPGQEVEVPLEDGEQQGIGTLKVMMGSSGTYLAPIDGALQAQAGSMDFVWPTLRFAALKFDVFAVGGVDGTCALRYEALDLDEQILAHLAMTDVNEVFAFPTLDLPANTERVRVRFDGAGCTSQANVAFGGGELTNSN